MRILVLRGGALGDFVVTLPALRLLRDRWPHACIELAGNPAAAALGVHRHYLDAVHNQHHARWTRLGDADHPLRADEPLAQWLAAFDLIVNYWPDSDGAIAADLTRLGFATAAGPDVRRGMITYPAHPTIAPAAAHYCAALAPLGLATDDFTAPLHLLPDDHAAATRILAASDARLIAWHPGGGSPAKIWRPERWLEVIRVLSACVPHRLVVVLGEADQAIEPQLAASAALPRNTIVVRNAPAPTLAAVLARCGIFLGHDTGPAHVAAAAGSPCVLVFGPTDPDVWAPPHAHVRVVRCGSKVDDVEAAEVLTVVRAAIG